MIPFAILGRPVQSTIPWAGNNCRLVVDGTSLTFGQGGAGTTYLSVISGLAPIQGTSTTTANLGISGQTAAQMRDSHADVDAAYTEGRINVMLAEGLTNSIYFGATPQQAVTDLLGYVAAIKAVHPWRVALQTAIPRYQGINEATITQPVVDAMNAALDAANALLRAQWVGVADHLIDLRAVDAPFAFANYTAATFDGSGYFIQESAPGGTIRTHCSPAGYTAWGTYAAAKLALMPYL